MKTELLNRAAFTLLLPVTALAVAGCWSLPNANVQPTGEPRMVDTGIAVHSVKNGAMVQSVDPRSRAIVLKLADGSTATYKVGQQVENLDQIKAGDKVKATVAEELTVYVLKNGQL